jgi:ketosteroid isomerase-like protein
MAASGDFGFNTGPWEFRQQLSDEKPTAFGQFLSVWKKESSGEWKVALDMGISHGQPLKNLERRVSMTRAMSGGQDLFEIEMQLVKDLNEKGWRAYNDFLASEARFLRTGSEPLTTKAEIERHLEDSSTGIYSFAHGEVAPTQDLAFTYGSVLFAENSDPKNREIKSYTRLWKRERDGWKIMVDLLSD